MPLAMKNSHDKSSGRSAGRTEEPAGLLGEVEQDRARIEHPRLAPTGSLGVDDRRDLAIWVDGAKGGRVLFAFGCVDGHEFVRHAEFFQQQRDLGGIGRRVEIKSDHGALSPGCGPRLKPRGIGGKLGSLDRKAKSNFR